MLKLLYGPSGAGKTARVIEEIRRDVARGVRCYLLVPEQQAYISERDLPEHLPPNAGLYFEVVHFSGLAEAVFRRYGGVADRSMHGGIRELLMWDTLRGLSPLLHCYRQSAVSDATLSERMLATVDELHANGIAPEALENAAAALDPNDPLVAKLSDLALVSASFHERCHALGAEDFSDRLARLSQVLDRENPFLGCHFYIDSFTGFTVQEFAVLRRILTQAETVTLTLCTDSLTSRAPHFEGIAETARRLLRMSADAGVETVTERVSVAKDPRPLSLCTVAEHLWNFSLAAGDRPTLSPRDAEAVRLVQCANVYEEVECAALNILDLVQSGIRYGEIAVVMRDAETYRGILDAALERHRIPYFLSERTDLASKPLSRLVLSALRAVSHNYRATDVLALVKTGLSGVDRRDAALFEEYCETWHITGSRFRDELWSMNPDGLTLHRSARAEEILEAANRTRKTLMDPLLRLESELRSSELLPDRCRAVYHYLCNVGIAEQMSRRAADELSLGQRREAGESLRLYRFAVDTLTELATLLPDARMSVDELTRALAILFSASDLGSVPESHDCVILGSASTLRVENVKASLLLGLCEGEFPRAVTDDGILTEGDKVTLEGVGISIDSTERRRNADELFYVYRAVTKPKEKLLLSTVLANTDASLRTPSMAFHRVAFLLSATAERFHPEWILPTGNTETDLLPDYAALPLPRGTALSLSQSKINAFALCPYRYYCTYRLKLRDRKDSTTTYSDDGLFLHAVLEQFLRASLGEDGRMHFPEEDALEALVDRIINEYIEEVCPMPREWMDDRLLHLFSRLRGMALLILRDLIDELEHSRFVPTYFEQYVGGSRENGIPAVVIPLSDGSSVRLSGVIDRVDLYREGDRVWVRVVDYKTSEHRFDLSKVASGEDIQLILYLHAILASAPGEYEGAGAEFLYTENKNGVRRVVRSGLIREEDELLLAADDTEKKLYTASLEKFPAQEIDRIVETMRSSVAGIARRILDGEATKTPSEEACRYCSVADHCDRAYRK